MTPRETGNATPIEQSVRVGAILRLAIPLMLASSGHAIRLLGDRIMLARYSREAIAASMPAGLASFVLMSLFIGIAGYVNTFIAQYTGAGRRERVGSAVWQGLYVALAGGAVVALLAGFAPAIFGWMGHAPGVQARQVEYFTILCRLSAPPGILLAAVLGFWSGRGLTYMVMAVELGCAALNIVLNTLLIFGRAGCPELGIEGAAFATGISSLCGLAVALALFWSRGNRKEFGTWPRRTFDFDLFKRLVRFGLPNGVQFALDLAAFNLFVALLGRYGTAELEATNMAFALNACVFIPLVGLGYSASILVGQCVGAERPDLARRAVRLALGTALLYSGSVAVLFVGAPHVVLAPFSRPGDPAQAAVLRMAARFLRYMAAYFLFDALFVIHHSAIKGAGDTRFAMVLGLGLSWGALVLPCTLAVKAGAPVDVMWGIFIGYVMAAGIAFYLRYRTGTWMGMRVIEAPPPPVVEPEIGSAP
jgi:multidrug resistance protein, MATE family